jgi:hypothetical protein
MKDWLEIAKGVFDVAKQCVIGLVILIVIFHPAGIGKWVEGTGLAEGEFLGLKWKKELKKTDSALIASVADKNELAEQLKLANDNLKKQSDLLNQLRDKAASPQADAHLVEVITTASKLIDQNQNALAAAQRSTQVAQQAIIANSDIVTRTQDTDATTQSQWAILAGSAPTAEAASQALQRPQGAGFPNARLFHNRGVYRTVLLFPDRKSAADALENVKDKVRPDAYMVELDKWCANYRRSPNDGATKPVECGT